MAQKRSSSLKPTCIWLKYFAICLQFPATLCRARAKTAPFLPNLQKIKCSALQIKNPKSKISTHVHLSRIFRATIWPCCRLVCHLVVYFPALRHTGIFGLLAFLQMEAQRLVPFEDTTKIPQRQPNPRRVVLLFDDLLYLWRYGDWGLYPAQKDGVWSFVL